MPKCPSCQCEVEERAILCEHCHCIVLRPPSAPLVSAASSQPDAMILGDMDGDESPNDFEVLEVSARNARGQTSNVLLYAPSGQKLSQDAIPERTSADPHQVPRTPYENFVLAAIDGRKSLRDIQRGSTLTPLDVMISCLTLRDKQLIQIRELDAPEVDQRGALVEPAFPAPLPEGSVEGVDADFLIQLSESSLRRFEIPPASELDVFPPGDLDDIYPGERIEIYPGAPITDAAPITQEAPIAPLAFGEPLAAPAEAPAKRQQETDPALARAIAEELRRHLGMLDDVPNEPRATGDLPKHEAPQRREAPHDPAAKRDPSPAPRAPSFTRFPLPPPPARLRPEPAPRATPSPARSKPAATPAAPAPATSASTAKSDRAQRDIARAAKLAAAAIMERDRGNLAAAQQNLKLALNFDPNSTELQRLQAELFAVKSASSKKSNPLLEQANEAERTGKTDKAIELLEAALKDDPNDPQALNRLGVMIGVKKGELARAERLIARALELSPKNATYEHNLNRVVELMAKRGGKGKQKKKGTGFFAGLLGKLGK